MTNALRNIPLADLQLSQTGSQGERRAHFNQAAIAELADSIKTVGVLQAIVTRQVNGHFEIVAGERRFMAAKLAGLEDIPASVRDLSDEQVLEIQLVENLQREGLHELQEAEGYEALMAKHGYSVEDLVAKVGKSRAYVYARLKLTALCKDARKAFYAGDLNASTALLVARVPGEEQQLRALKHVTEKDWNGRPLSYREAAKYIHDTFMLKLSDAPFSREDVTLVPSAGACGPCPMRTGNAPDLFGDVKGADVCTNPGCFQAKKAAHIKRELEKARASGETVIRGGDARRILPDRRYYGYSSDGAHKQLRNGYARPGDKCLDDPKKRTYAELAGKDAPRVLLQNPDTGRIEKVFEVAAITDQLKAKGIKPKPQAKDSSEARAQDEEQRKQEREIELRARRAIFQAAIKAAPAKISHDDLAVLVSTAFERGYGDDEEFYRALGWDMPKSSGRGDSRKAFLDRLLKLSESELARLAVVAPVIDDVLECYEKPEELEALARRLGVDVKKIRADLVPEIQTPAPEKKAAKAKAAKKK